MPKKPSPPKGYTQRNKGRKGSKPESVRKPRNLGIRALQKKAATEGIRSLTRDEHERLKLYQAEKEQKKRSKLPSFEARKEDFVKAAREKRERAKFLRHEVEFIFEERLAALDETSDEYIEDDDDRQDYFDEFIGEWGIDLDEWLEIAAEEGYTDHEAYEMWFYP